MHPYPRHPVALAALLLLALPGCREPRPDASGRPNVLFVSIDTLRADHLSVYGYHRETSPFLESFARQATVFEHAYSHWPSTLKSHMSMFTSLFPDVHGVEKDEGLGAGIPLLAELLQQAGYRTAGYYSLGWLDPKFGFGRGFDRYRFKDSGDAVRKAALSIMRKSAGKSSEGKSAGPPFFLFFHVREVHCGPGLKIKGRDLYTSPPEFRDAFLPYPDVEVPHLAGDIWNNRVRLNEKELANVVAHYDGGILHADSILRATFEAMKSYGIFDDTLIVVTSDHGESIGQRNVFGHGGIWEEGVRVPLIVKLPASHPESERWRGARLEYRVQAVDLAPTILRIVDVPAPATYQGRDLFDPLKRDVMTQSPHGSVLIQGDYKLMRMHEGRTFLYDLANDPGETVSIGGDRPELVAAMLETLESHLQANRSLRSSDGKNPVQLDEEQRKRLESLGYVN